MAANDVRYETDFRSVYAKVIDNWLGADSAADPRRRLPRRARLKSSDVAGFWIPLLVSRILRGAFPAEPAIAAPSSHLRTHGLSCAASFASIAGAQQRAGGARL